jgi:hypothetical protein
VNAEGVINTDVTFAEMTPQFANPSSWTWSPLVPADSYPWVPGTYYWQVFHIDCAATPTCDVASPVWQFTITPAGPPQPASPPDYTTVQAGSTVTLSVNYPVGGLETFIQVPGSGGTLTVPAYGFSLDGHTSYFRLQMGSQPGTLPWTPIREDCKLGPTCPADAGTTWHLTVVAPASAAPPTLPVGKPKPKALCRAGYTVGKIGGNLRCLRAGEYCAKRFARQYRRYRLACVKTRGRYRLKRI